MKDAFLIYDTFLAAILGNMMLSFLDLKTTLAISALLVLINIVRWKLSN